MTTYSSPALPASTAHPLPALFPIGRAVITPAALQLLEAGNTDPRDLIARHVRGDWSEMSEDDQEANRHAIADGDRVFSAYTAQDETKIYVITEADRSSTCILLASEY